MSGGTLTNTTYVAAVVPSHEPGRGIPVRIYGLGSSNGQSGCIVMAHGGGFVTGSMDAVEARCHEFAVNACCVVVSVGYRLAPEHPFPAAVLDLWDVLNWIQRGHLGEAVDERRLAVGGVSAGATLALSVTIKARDLGFPALRLLLLDEPPVDHRLTTVSSRLRGTPVIDRKYCLQMWGHYLTPGAPATSDLQVAAPGLLGDLRGLPRTHLSIAQVDPLRDECLGLASTLAASGVPIEAHLYPGTVHGFTQMPIAVGRRAVLSMVDAIRDSMQPRQY